MAEKDMTEKILMSHADVFADCINALVYGGEQRLNAENTQPAPTESFYKGKELHNQFCDTGRFLTACNNIIVHYMIENETRPEERQVFRKVSYQGGAYRQQLESDALAYAVICIVLAWSGKTNRIPLSLHQLLAKNGVPEKDLEHADDAKLMVYHMNNLPHEVRKLFISDMGFVVKCDHIPGMKRPNGHLTMSDAVLMVDYLNEGSFEGRKEQRIVHLEALCDMMEALTGDSKFTEQAKQFIEKEGKGKEIMMCEYINALGAKGENRLTTLLKMLYDLGRDADVKLAVQDPDMRAKLYKEFHIQNI